MSKPKTILCYGDSNTWGYDPVNIGRYEPDVRWPGVLQKELGQDYSVIEEGLCGRTTVWDDPVEGDRNGLQQLTPILLSHCPLDLVVLMLGTNDLKSRFAVSALDIAHSIGRLVQRARTCETDYTGPAPEVLVVCPPPLNPAVENGPFADSFVGGLEKSRSLAAAVAAYCRENAIPMIDAGEVSSIGATDGIHLEEPAHLELGKAIARRIHEITRAGT